MARLHCVGVAVADFVFYVDEFPERAEKYRARDAAVVGGGNAANSAVAAARLGGEVSLMARLGGDPVAGLIEAELAGEGIDLSPLVRAPDGRSSFSSILVDGAGERQIMNFRGTGLSNAIKPLPEDTQVVLCDTRWTEGAMGALRMARDAGLPGVVDGEAPMDASVLSIGSHLAFSAQGLRSVEDTGDLAADIRTIAQRFGAWAAVTDDERGTFATRGGPVEHFPAFAVEVVDTLGAGDVWHGAFALALAEGQAEEDAVVFASAAAALKCTRVGGRAGAPHRAEVEAFLKENGHGA